MTLTAPEQMPFPGSAVTAVTAWMKPRQIEGNSAVLLPFHEDGTIHYIELAAHIERTAATGLRPCVNMDTGYVNLLTSTERRHVLEIAQEVMGSRSFIAGAFIEGQEGDLLDLYQREVDTIQQFGGLPILFQSHALQDMDEDALIGLHQKVANNCEQLLIFELGKMFASFGTIYSIDVVARLMEIPQITGMKHSSLNREQEWARLELRDRKRPDFKIYTGNDLAIDMVMYGSDYLLGLSTFAPEKFAERDRLWAQGDTAFYQLNDLLQYLGFFAFRSPTPAYKHSAAQFLKLRGFISSDKTHPNCPERPSSDIAVLRDIAERLELI